MSYSTIRVGRMLFVRWGEMTVEDIEEVKRDIEAFSITLGGRPAMYVSVTDGRSTPPDDRARVAMVRSAEELMPILSRLYVVIETQGFAGSVHRSALAGMLLVSSLRKKVKVVATVEEALEDGARDLGVELHVARAKLAASGLLEAS